MSFVKISNELLMVTAIELENMFILEHMPYAPENYTKIYLYGKMLAKSAASNDNSLLRMSKLLGMTEDEILDGFSYWKERGLVTLNAGTEIEIEYLPVVSSRPSMRKFSVTKYTPFNEQLMKMFPAREFTITEYNEYYSVMEDYHIEVDAMLYIFSYCARQKGKNVGWKYIVTVARNLAKEGCRTADEVEQELNLGAYDDSLKEIFKVFKLRRRATYDDRTMFKRWTVEYGFDMSGILMLALETKYGDIKGLDALIKRYFTLGITTPAGINKHIGERDALLKLTKEILNQLDVRYTRLEHYAEMYVEGWLAAGFEPNALTVLAAYSFKHNYRSCESMKGVVDKFSALKLFTAEEIQKHLEGKVKYDDKIKIIFKIADSEKRVSSRDREIYAQWLDWGISDELITLAAKKSVGSENPLSYMNRLISVWEENGVKSAAEAEKVTGRSTEKKTPAKSVINADEVNRKLFEIDPEDI